MKLFNLFILSLITLFIAACGGNGSKTSGTTSQVSSSSVTPVNCATYAGAVFVDFVCSPWRKLSIFEMNSVTSASREITDTNISEVLTYNIIDTNDTAHHQVLDIKYADQSVFNGVVHIFAPESATNSLDLAEYATGKLIFDLKVINEGSAKPDLEFNIECGWPCGSTPKIIKPTELNKWQTVEISVAEMISRGLDITKVGTGFLLIPTWGKQANTHFQVDNIRWVKGIAVTPTETVCYANYLDAPSTAIQGNMWLTTTIGTIVDSSKIATPVINPSALLKIDWSGVKGKWTYSLSDLVNYQTGELINPITLSACSSSGTLSVEIYTPKSLVDDGNLKFTMHFADKNRTVYEIPNSQSTVANLKPNDWNKISVNLSESAQHADLVYVGFSFDSTTVNTMTTEELKIDNLVITQPIK